MMTTITANESISPLLVLLDEQDAGPILVQNGDHSAVMLSTSNYELMKAAQEDDFDRVCAIISANAQARGMTEEKLAEILAEIDAETPR